MAGAVGVNISILLGVCNLTGVWRGHPEPGKITPPIVVEQSPPSLDFTVK